MVGDVSIEALGSAYRTEKDSKVRERILMIKMLREGKTSVDVGRELSCSHPKVLYWKYRFEEEGLAGLKTRRRQGRPPKVPMEKMERIKAVVDGAGGGGGGWWTAKAVRELIQGEGGVSYSVRHVQRLLHVWGFDLIRPSRKHVNKAGKEEVEAFKKGLKKPS